jgi:hypothetical protein
MAAAEQALLRQLGWEGEGLIEAVGAAPHDAQEQQEPTGQQGGGAAGSSPVGMPAAGKAAAVTAVVPGPAAAKGARGHAPPWAGGRASGHGHAGGAFGVWPSALPSPGLYLPLRGPRVLGRLLGTDNTPRLTRLG